MSEFECEFSEVHGASEIRTGRCPCGGRLRFMDGYSRQQLEKERRDHDNNRDRDYQEGC